MDLVRERRVPLGDRLWAQFAARAAGAGLNTSEAMTSAIMQWLCQDPQGRCPQCGARLCHPTAEHHEDWCPERGDDARVAQDIPPQPCMAAAEVPKMLRSVLLH